MTMIQPGVVYRTTEGPLVLVGQAVPRQRAGVYDWAARRPDRTVAFASRDRSAVAAYIAARLEVAK